MVARSGERGGGGDRQCHGLRGLHAGIRRPVERRSGLRSEGCPDRFIGARSRIAVHEPCTLQHGLRLTGSVTALLARLGFDPQPVRDAHLCCGSAGAYSLLQPEISGALREAKLAALTEHAPAAIYTANIGCWMHLSEGTDVPVRHWIEAVEEVARP